MSNKKSIVVLLFQLLQTLLSVVSLVLISRGLEVTLFGNYIYVVTVCSLLALFSGIGSEHVFLMYASKDFSQTETLFGNAILIRTIVNLVLIFVGTLINWYTKFKFLDYSIFLLSYGIASYVNPLFIAYYRVKGTHIKPWIFSLIGPLVFLLYLIFYCRFSGLFELSIGFLLSNLCMFFLFLIDLKSNINFRIDKFQLLKNCKMGIVFMTSQIFDFIFLRIDILLVKIFLGPYLLGIYAVGQRLVSFLQIIPSSFHIVELPIFHRLSNNLEELELRFINLRSVLLQVGVLLFGLLILNAKWLIILFFSDKYIESANVVFILSIAGLITFVSYPYYMLAEALNKINTRLYIRIASLTLTIIVLFVLSHFLKIIGSSIAVLIGNLIFLFSLHRLTYSGNGGLKSTYNDFYFLFISSLVLTFFLEILNLNSKSIFLIIICNLFYTSIVLFLILKFGKIKLSEFLLNRIRVK